MTLAQTSEDGEEGYPGRLEVRVRYQLVGSSVHITYDAVSDKDTICNLTNHSYFNLSGHDSGDVLNQQLMICADTYLPTEADGVPSGVLESVESTSMDFRTMHPIGLKIDDNCTQLSKNGGYDHCYVINGAPHTMRTAALAKSDDTGICMTVFTDMPGIQLYTANGLGPGRPGKVGASYGPREAFCLETQYFPDSPNKEHFPSATLCAGEHYHSETVYSFSVM